MLDLDHFRTISKEDLAWFGLFERAYVKPVRRNGRTLYEVFAANGILLSRARDRNSADQLIREEYRLEAVSTH